MPRIFKTSDEFYNWNPSHRAQHHQGARVRSMRTRPYYLGVSSVQVGSGNATLSVHANAVAGDLIVGQLTYRNGSDPGTPSGWNWIYKADYLTGEWYGHGYAVISSPGQTFVFGGSGYKAVYAVNMHGMANELVTNQRTAAGTYGADILDFPANTVRAGDVIFLGASAAYTAYDFIFPYGEWWVSGYVTNGDNTPTTVAWKIAHEDNEPMGGWRFGPWGMVPGGNAQTMGSVWR